MTELDTKLKELRLERQKVRMQLDKVNLYNKTGNRQALQKLSNEIYKDNKLKKPKINTHLIYNSTLAFILLMLMLTPFIVIALCLIL